MRKITIILLALLCREAFGNVGDSNLGVFITPPTWAASSTPVTVPVRYTPLGVHTGAPPIRLNIDAALGMCATLDAFAERVYVPLFEDVDKDRTAYLGYTPYYPDPFSTWPSNNYPLAGWPTGYNIGWPGAAERQIANSWSRIFPRVSSMLSDVRRELRQLALGDGEDTEASFVYNRTLSSSLFGGRDIVPDFTWCTRDVAINELTNVADVLCLDWSCTADHTRPCNRVVNAFDTILDLSEEEVTNIYARSRYDAPPPLSNSVWQILSQFDSEYVLTDGWLTNSFEQSRISANDFGWMNKMIAAIDKSYYQGAGLSQIQFMHTQSFLEADYNLPITNGVFYLHSDGDATLEDIFTGDPNVSTSGQEYATTPINMSLSFSLAALDADSTAYANSERGNFSINPVRLATDYGVAQGAIRPVLFTGYSGGEGGPVIEIYIATADGTTPTYWEMVDHFRVLDRYSSLPLSSGQATCVARGDIMCPTKLLGHGLIGDWYPNNSAPYVYPIKLPNYHYMDKVSYQIAAKRYSYKYNPQESIETNVEFFARGVERGKINMDAIAYNIAHTIFDDCKDWAKETMGLDVDNPSSALQKWLDDNSKSMIESSLRGHTSWGVETVGTAYLISTNDTYRLFTEELSSNGTVYVELPFVEDLEEQIYGGVRAGGRGMASTNVESGLKCDILSSAAIYWKFKNLPLSQPNN